MFLNRKELNKKLPKLQVILDNFSQFLQFSCFNRDFFSIQFKTKIVPPPQRLIVERQLHKSVLIGWLHPECPRTMIDHYQIYVDGVHKATIPAGDRTKALVEGVDSSMVIYYCSYFNLFYFE